MKKIRKNRIIIALIMSIMISGLGFSTNKNKEIVKAENINMEEIASLSKVQKTDEIRYTVNYIWLKNSPKIGSSNAQMLEVGTTVKVLKEYDSWRYVEILLPWSNEAINKGWIKQDELYTYSEMVEKREKNGEEEVLRGITVQILKGAEELGFSDEVIGNFQTEEYGRVFDVDKNVFELELANGDIVRINQRFIEILK